MPAAVVVCGVLLAGCADRAPTSPCGEPDITHIRLTAHVTGVVQGVSVEVSALDIDPPSVQNLTVSDGIASGAVAVTTGMDRTLTVRARDARGIETHAGSTTVDVHPGANVQLNLTLEPVSGDVPITVELATYVVTLDPATATVAVNDMVQLAVAVEDGAGNPVFNPEVAWGSTHPDVAWVDQTGVLIAVSPGVATIAANYRGTVGLAEVTIF